MLNFDILVARMQNRHFNILMLQSLRFDYLKIDVVHSSTTLNLKNNYFLKFFIKYLSQKKRDLK